jgi:hypothetical protein
LFLLDNLFFLLQCRRLKQSWWAILAARSWLSKMALTSSSPAASTTPNPSRTSSGTWAALRSPKVDPAEEPFFHIVIDFKEVLRIRIRMFWASRIQTY